MELFRIVATFMILLTHHSTWFLNLYGIEHYWSVGHGMGLMSCMIDSISCIGVPCFILISGYYSIKPKWKSIINLFSLLFFFYVGCYILKQYGLGDGTFHLRTWVRTCMAFSRENWFIQCYLFLMLLSPILNAFIEKVTERKLLQYIAMFLGCAFYFGCVHNSAYFYFNGGYSVTTFILLYLVGRYISLYGRKKISVVSSPWLLLLWFICCVIIVLLEYYLHSYSRFNSYCSPIQIVSASLLLVIFSRIHIKSKVINWVANSCLAVYILHTSQPFLSWLVDANGQSFTTYSPLLWLGTILLDSIIVFTIAIVLDKIRQFVFNPLMRNIDNLIKK